jgi:foldase protein PrsA
VKKTMGKRRYALIVVAMVLCLAVFLGGCGKKEKKLSSESLKEGELFRLNGTVCTKPEALVFVLSQKNRYEAGCGAGIWDVKVGERTFEEYMKENLQDFLVKMKCMALMAEQYEVEISDEDDKRISQAASVYLEGLPDQVKKDTGIDKKTTESVFREYYTASLLMEKLTADVSMEISEDEARVITVQQIYVNTAGMDEAAKGQKRAELEGLLARVQAGDDFAVLAKDKNESDVFERELARGDAEQAFEAAAFALSMNEVSPVVETSDGLYLIRCVNNYDEAKTAQNKENLGKKHKADRFNEYYSAFVEQVTAVNNEGAWESLDYKGSYGLQETDFYLIYNQYFPSSLTGNP